MVGINLGRRKFLELLFLGSASAAVHGCNCSNSSLYKERRPQPHDYQLPTLLEVQNTNIAHLILDWDYSFGLNGAIPSMQNHDNYKIAKERLETFYGRGKRYEFSPDFIQNATSSSVRLILSQIRKDFRATMMRYSSPVNDTQDSFCNFLLEQRYDCDTYSILTLGLAEKYGLPLYGVIIPDHIFTRWKTGKVHINFDQGAIGIDDAEYIDGAYNSHSRPIASSSLNGRSIYIKSLDKLEFVAHYLANISFFLRRNQEYAAALDLINIAKGWSEKDPDIHLVRSNILKDLGHIGEANRELRMALKLDPCIINL